MKKQLLKILREDPTKIYSGEFLAQELGISRVSVWKHLKKLQELGYEIDSGPKGYQYSDSVDALYPWEFPGRESSIHFYEEVESTMITAKELARKGCAHFSVVIANRQKSGRGRLKRKWVSEDGGLYFTLILRPEIAPSMMSQFSFAASLSLARALRETYQVDARVKWPNDLLINEKKISGMLCEMEMESDQVSFLNIGIGLNVNNNPTEVETNATSLKLLLGKTVSRRELLEKFLDHLAEELDKPNLDHVIPAWKEHAITLKRKVKIVTTSETWEGTAVDVDENGALLLKLSDDSIKTVYYGDCFHQI